MYSRYNKELWMFFIALDIYDKRDLVHLGIRLRNFWNEHFLYQILVDRPCDADADDFYSSGNVTALAMYPG